MKKTLRIIEAALIVLLILYLAFVNMQQSAKDVPLSRIQEKIEKECDMSEFTEPNLRKKFNQNYGMDMAQFSDVVYYASDNVMDVNELLIIKVSNDSQLDAIEQAVSAHLDQQIQTFHGYGTDQEFLLKNAVTFTRGNYYFLGISPDASTWEDLVLSSIKGGSHGIF